MRYVRLFLLVLLASMVAVGCSTDSQKGQNPIVSSIGDSLSVNTEVGVKGDSRQLFASWDPSGWQNAIILEAKHALSTRNNGTSGVILYWGSGTYYGGDWDYVNDPGGASALQTMKNHYNSGDIGSYGLWEENDLTKACVYVGHGGFCKFFADLVQWRATGGAKGFLPTNSSASGSIDYVEPSDIIQRTDSYPHTAIVIAILARSGGKVTAVDVIDANYIGTTRTQNRFIIARHPISGSELQHYHTYH